MEVVASLHKDCRDTGRMDRLVDHGIAVEVGSMQDFVRKLGQMDLRRLGPVTSQSLPGSDSWIAETRSASRLAMMRRTDHAGR